MWHALKTDFILETIVFYYIIYVIALQAFAQRAPQLGVDRGSGRIYRNDWGVVSGSQAEGDIHAVGKENRKNGVEIARP